MGLEIIEVIARQCLEIKFNHVTALNNSNKQSCPRVRTRINKIQRFSSTFRESRLWRGIFLPTVAVKFGHCPSSCCPHWALDIPLRSLPYSLTPRGLQSHSLLSLKYILKWWCNSYSDFRSQLQHHFFRNSSLNLGLFVLCLGSQSHFMRRRGIWGWQLGN